MIGTIGSLVQETSNRWRWLLTASLYTLACVSTAMLLGALLSVLGHLVRNLIGGVAVYMAFPHREGWLIGLLALAYAASDMGLLWMPRPILMKAVPITWWRWWRPYGAALAYGAALGLGVTTRIPFGAFYVLCACCMLKGDVTYGTFLMGAYGAARALVLLPVSWGFYCRRIPITRWDSSRIFNVERAQQILAIALVIFGTQAIASSILIVR